ncbi:hypothetical protein EDL81_01490 [Ehrlichia ruminantium]|uniref:hypothetical protein n=1 Tax=Ehrlichia ruminantium TaxID=779 RepID=UPI00130EA299|nr:hypothetical protein [Ehrlichia ruminantium]QGR02350.1 hypothetical protein EDL81_01490 [Ehrlichia ruminantium]
MLSLLKKGVEVVVKVAITPATTKLPHKESLGKIIQGALPGKGPKEKYFDLQVQDPNYKAGIELPAETRVEGNQNEVTFKLPYYKLDPQSLQKFAAWQEQDKEGNVEETKQSLAQSLLEPSKKFKELEASYSADSKFNILKKLDEELQKTGGKLTVESKLGSYRQRLNIEIDTSGKSLQEIEGEVKHALSMLGIRDSKLVKTSAARLYKSSTDPKVTSLDINTKDPTPNTQEALDSEKISSGSTPENEGYEKISSVNTNTNQSSTTEHAQNPDKVESNNFSLTNPTHMPYRRSPLQSSSMLQQLQGQMLMQSSPSTSSPAPMPPNVRQSVEKIAAALSDTLSHEAQGSNISTTTNSKGKPSSSQGKVHR